MSKDNIKISCQIMGEIARINEEFHHMKVLLEDHSKSTDIDESMVEYLKTISIIDKLYELLDKPKEVKNNEDKKELDCKNYSLHNLREEMEKELERLRKLTPQNTKVKNNDYTIKCENDNNE